ncbi:MAG: mechanosensitive ion channel family protein [Alphaproteobacteria bacterium]
MHWLRFISGLAGLAGVIVAALVLACPAGAAEPAASPAAEVQALDDLVETLKDEGRRDALVRDLEALAAARRDAAAASAGPADETGIVGRMASRAAALGDQVVETVAMLGALPTLLPWVERQLDEPAAREHWLLALATILAVLLAGILAELIARRLLAGTRRHLVGRAGGGVMPRVLLMLAGVLVEMVPVAAFYVVAQLLLPLFSPHPTAVIATRMLVEASVVARLVLVLARGVLAPYEPTLRPLRLSDESANYAYIWVRRISGVAVYGWYAAAAAGALGLPAAGVAVLLKLVGLVLVAQAIMLILQLRLPVRERLGRGGPLARLADVWHVLAIVYVSGVYAVWAFQTGAGFGFLLRATAATFALVFAARLAEAGAMHVLDRAFRLRAETRALYPHLEQRANRYLPVVRGAVRAAIWILATVLLAEMWGINLVAWMAEPFGRRLLAAAIQIVVVLAGAVLLLEFVNAAIERYLVDKPGSTHVQSQRLRTLLPLLRAVVRIAVGVVVVLIVLSQIGVDIAPLLAGAGVIGLAIGFGSQKLVQDVITGMFILIEDTVSVGDVVDVGGGHLGIVEAVTIRTIRLRDISGAVHVVPFSDVSSVTNLSKDFSFAVIDAGVAYREDTDEVVAVLEEVARSLQEDAVFGSDILSPLEVLGVDQLADSAVVVKVRIKTLPLRRWAIQREFNRRMKKAFDAAGIEIPFPQQTVWVGEPKAAEALAARTGGRFDDRPDNLRPPSGVHGEAAS